MMSQQKFWDAMAARYARSRIRDEVSYQRKLTITQQYLQPDWEVLEFGCGTGSTALIHAPHVASILATDISGNMLAIAQDKAVAAGIANVRFAQGSLNTLDLSPERFDAVLGLNILHLLEDVPDAIARVHSLLKPAGVFVSSTMLLAAVPWYWRVLIPLAQRLGKAPFLAHLERDGLMKILRQAGFEIEYEWQPSAMSLFVVARKAPCPT